MPLDKISISKKTLIAPVLNLVFMVVILVFAVHTLTGIMTSTIESQSASHFSNKLGDDTFKLSSVHNNFYKAINWKTNSVSDAKIKPLVASSMASMLDIKKDLAEQNYQAHGISPELIKSLNDSLTSYGDQIKMTMEFMDTDISLAPLYMGQSQTEYEKVNKALASISDAVDSSANNFQKQAVQSISAGKIAIVFGLALAAVLGLVVGAFVGRSIARPLVQLTQATQELATGNRNIDVPHRQKEDEICKLATAVEIFKQNAIKIDQLQIEQSEKRREVEARQMETLQIADEFKKKGTEVIQSVSTTAGDMRVTARGMSALADKLGIWQPTC